MAAARGYDRPVSSPPTVSVVVARPSPLADYAIGVLAGAIGFRTRTDTGVGHPDGPCLHYGGSLESPHDRCVLVPERPADRLWSDLLSGGGGPPDRRLPFDVVAATAALLTDVENRDPPSGATDRHGRLTLAGSFQGRTGHGTTAIVNRYADALGSALALAGLRDPLPRWPDGRRAAIGLSHDVDRPDKYAVLRAVAGSGPGTWLRRPELVLRAGRDLLAWTRDADRDDFWQFQPLIAAERDRGLRSTFLFAAMPSHGAYGSRHDVHYDIGWPRFRRLFATLAADGVEVALHASYDAHRRSGRVAAERERLARLACVDVTGIRHHYWQLGADPSATLRAHQAAGLAWDSSLAFNDAPGLRRGIALPFRPWDEENGRSLSVIQLPVLAMDAALLGDGATADEAVEALWGSIGEVRAVGGLGVLDWHVRMSYPANRRYRSCGEAYLGTLDRLAGADDLWVTDLGTIERWWREREAVLAS
jgi:hypothetical protein